MTSTAQIRVVLVDDVPMTLAKLTRLLGFEEGIDVIATSGTARGGIDEVLRQKPDVVVMDINLPDLDGIRATQELTQSAPNVPVVLISVQEDREYLRRAMQAGARGYLVKPFSGDDLVATIRRVASSPGKPMSGATTTSELPALRPDAARTAETAVADEKAAATEAAAVEPAVVEPAEPQPPGEAEPAEKKEPAQVIAVFSGKGGVGKSLIAINLAASLRAEGKADVAIMDLDLQFGDIAVLMGVQPTGTMYELAQAYPNVDATAIGAMMPEGPAGVRVLAAPVSPELADLITPEHVEAVISLLKATFDHVVLDCSTHLDDRVLEALEDSDQIVLVTDLNLPAIKDAKLALQLFETLKIPRDHVKLVVNRADAPAVVTVEQVEKNLGLAVAVQIPSQGKQVLKSLQDKIPIVMQLPKAPISLKIGELASALVPLPQSARRGPGRKGFWARSGGN